MKVSRRALVLGAGAATLGSAFPSRWSFADVGVREIRLTAKPAAVNLTGNDPTITEHLGDAYSKMGKSKEASHEYADALKKAQETEQVSRLKDKLQVLQNAASAGH